MKLFAVTAELTLDLLGGNARVGLSSSTAYIPVKKVFSFFYCLFNDLKAKKSKDFHVHAMNTCRGNRVIAPLILNLGIRGGEWLVTRTCRFIPGKEPRYTLDRRDCLDVVEKTKIFACNRIRTPDRPVRSPVTIPTMQIIEN
jgi:hypothetical protein